MKIFFHVCKYYISWIFNIFWYGLRRSSSYYMYFRDLNPQELVTNMKSWHIILFWYYFLIKLNIRYVHVKLEYKQIQIGANGCKWVMMNAFGCRGHGGGTKKGKKGKFRAYEVRIWALWSGKISTTMMFCGFCQKW